MASKDITINGIPLNEMGAALEHGGYSALMMPAPLKEFVENDDPLKDGTEVITEIDDESVAKLRERDVTLTFLIKGKDREDFLEKYNAFTSLLQKGSITLNIPDLGQIYRLIYSNATQYDNYLLKACRLAVKFREPNPANRGIEKD